MVYYSINQYPQKVFTYVDGKWVDQLNTFYTCTYLNSCLILVFCTPLNLEQSLYSIFSSVFNTLQVLNLGR